eukprot:scaffold48784_cov76-Phaeocystis_antarctica.AAC.2
MLPAGTGRCVAHEHSDRTTDTRSQEWMPARAGVKTSTELREASVDGLCGVPVIVSSHHVPCSGPGTARHSPRAYPSCPGLGGVECGTTAHCEEHAGMQGSLA